MSEIKINHDLVPLHYMGQPKFIKYLKKKSIAVYKVTDSLSKKLYNLKNYLLIYKENDKYCHKYVDKIITGDKALGQDKKQPPLGTRVLQRRNKKAKKRNKKTKTRKS